MKTQEKEKPQIKTEQRLYLQAYLVLVSAAFLFGGNTVAMRIVSQGIPIFTLSSIRVIMGLSIILPFAWNQLNQGPKPNRKELFTFAVLGLCGVLIPYNCLSLGLKYTTVVNASIIGSTGAALTITLLAIGWRVFPSKIQILGVIISTLGLFVVFTQGSWHNLLALKINPGDFIIFIQITSISFFSIIGQEIMKKFSPLVTSVYALLFGVIMMIPFLVWELYTWEGHFTIQVWLVLAYMGFIVSGVAFLLNLRGIQLIGSGKAAIFGNLTPIFGILLGMIILDERLHFYHWIGGILVFAGVFLSLSKESLSYFRRTPE